MRILLILILALFAFSSCKHSIIEADKDPLVNTWVYQDFDRENDGYIYISMPSLSDALPGYIFNEDGTATVRQNEGWCGTPPVSYDDFDGDWYYENDSILHISTNYWGSSENGSKLEYRYRIVELNEDRLVISWVL